jgi:hypothetical protein
LDNWKMIPIDKFALVAIIWLFINISEKSEFDTNKPADLVYIMLCNVLIFQYTEHFQF